MDARALTAFLAAFLLLAGCEREEEPQQSATPAAEPAPVPASAPAEAAPSFVNKVWEVAESRQVARGELRTFLSDGTLVMASPNATPAFGQWRQENGRLTITEEGQEYPADILELTEDSFRIRMHSPGEPVEILFRPAEPAEAAALASTHVAEDEPVDAAAAERAEAGLLGTAWRLENLAGAEVVDGVQATLEFPSEGRASGNGSCNRFNGVVTVEGPAIRFGGVAATRKACADAVMRQEESYFAALQEAERYETDGDSLRIHTSGRPEPLTFAAIEATAAVPAQSISRAAAGAGPAPAGIWTVVSHHVPGASAIGDDAARARYGDTIRLTAGAAISPGGRCDGPRYSTRRVPADSWLASEYKLPRGSLRMLTGLEQIRVIEVSCGGSPWNAFGARILEIDTERALAPWDGVFFELERDHDFRGLGQEPGWQLEIRKGADIRFIYDYGQRTVTAPVAKPQVDPESGTRTWQATSAGNDLRAVVVPVRCSDVMSGRPFPATVSVTLNGRSYRGCGQELATPFE
jgi:heat shock protein HslJ/uncharacterized membrane protein